MAGIGGAGIRLRGIRASIPSGYMLGRTAQGSGEVQAIPMGAAGKAIVSAGGSTGTGIQQWQAGQVASVGTSLAINSGTIDLSTEPATTLMGNPGTGSAVPTHVAVGNGLSLSVSGTLSNSGVLSINTSGNGIATSGTTGNDTLTVEWNAGTINAIGAGLTAASNTLSNTGVLSINTSGSGIATSGTTGNDTLTVEWNAGTVNALGSGLSLASNTLSNSGVLSINTSGSGIATSGTTGNDTLTVEWNAGTVNALGSGLTLTTGTLSSSGGGSSEWTAGTVTAISSQFSITAGDTLEIANLGSYQVLGNNSGSSAQPTGVYLPTILASALASAGGELYVGTGPGSMGFVTRGSNGQFLIAQNVGNAPAWEGTIVATGSVAVSLGSTGPTGINSSPSAWVEIVLAGTTYYWPLWT